MTNRHYGLDLFRFIGAFIVLAGHLTFLLAFTPATQITDYLISPLFWFAIISVPVPVFIMISGYFGLARPNKENEDEATLKRFSNILIKYVGWIVILVIANIIINGATVTNNTITDIIFALFNPAQFTIDMMGPIVGQGKFFVQTAPLWYLYTFAGLLLISPILKGFFSSSNIKLVRLMMVVLFIGTFFWPSVNLYAKTVFADSPLISKIFASASLFDLNKVSYSLLYYYLLGAWLKLEPGYKKFVDRLPSYAAVLGLVVSLIPSLYYTLNEAALWRENPTSNAGFSLFGSGYESLLLLPGALMMFVLFNKLDSKITEESVIGRFVKKNSHKALGIYLTHTLVIGITHNIIGFSRINAFLTGFSNDAVQSIVYFGFAAIIFFVTYLFVSLIKRIPAVKNLL